VGRRRRAPPRAPRRHAGRRRGGDGLSEWFSFAGAALLTAATIPQVVKLLRTRSAGDFSYGFAVLNFVGIAMLGLRSLQIGEWGFVFVNATTAAFWALVLGMKLATGDRAGLGAGSTTLLAARDR
jgi:MtN3 and saliva related transmembrane protein